MEILLPVAERSAAITHARTNQAVVGVLLERMRDPSGGAADSENCGRHRARKSEHADAYGQVEVEIGAQAFAFRYRGFDFGAVSKRRRPRRLAIACATCRSSAARGSPSG